jgi:3'-phosphoadenosine 5'-phosphosulfate sulfotransferase (PAPS reductase)/FAD synthetase
LGKNTEHKERAASDKVRHILSISGGKDSSALAIYMRDRDTWRERLGKRIAQPADKIDMEYVFCDTKEELRETYEYLDILEAFLGKRIVRLSDDRGFQHWLQVYGNYLPSPNMRWCTRMLKLKPFEEYVGDDLVYSYVGIRADENRDGYISKKPNIIPVFPFKEDGITRDDVMRILNESGASLPKYYEWRTRSGCYFCFFQRKAEWVGLMEHHPDLFEKAKEYEKQNKTTGERYTWSQGESLEDLSKPERVAEIKANHERLIKIERQSRPNRPLVEVFSDVLDDEEDEAGCTICHL